MDLFLIIIIKTVSWIFSYFLLIDCVIEEPNLCWNYYYYGRLFDRPGRFSVHSPPTLLPPPTPAVDHCDCCCAFDLHYVLRRFNLNFHRRLRDKEVLRLMWYSSSKTLPLVSLFTIQFVFSPSINGHSAMSPTERKVHNKRASNLCNKFPFPKPPSFY